MSKWALGSLVMGLLVTAACGATKDDPSPGDGEAAAASGAELCGAQFDAFEKSCPSGDARDTRIEICQEDQRHYDGIGCRQKYDAWLACTTLPLYDCTQDTGCEGAQSGYFTCQSQAVQRTGCVRLGAQDAMRCTDTAKPYAFGCLAAAPASCVQVVTEGAGIWCCPQL